MGDCLSISIPLWHQSVTSIKLIIYSEIDTDLAEFRLQIACHYLNLRNISDMLIIY
jgi:hypothetical protein